MTADILRKSVAFYNTLTLLSQSEIVLCVFWDFSFSGFLRYVKLFGIHVSDIRYSDNHTEIRVKSSETDQYRQGQTVISSKTSTDLFLVS